jgi:hypothetical protein
VWNTEWENAIKTHYNTHCYPGEYWLSVKYLCDWTETQR